MENSILAHKISFVVIAKNEIFAIEKCINSIITIGDKLDNYEVIFVDSLSNDGTLEKVMHIKNDRIQIFQITKNANAAVARNIGIKYVKYEYIFFIDGDVEIQLDFVISAIEEMKDSFQIGAIYGQLKEFQYSNNYSKIIRIVKDRMEISKKVFQIVKGGIFFTKYSVVKNIGSFDERLKRGEDRDYIMRVRTKYKVLGLPIQMGIHHTIAYRNITRAKKMLCNFHNVYLGVLLRKYIFNLTCIAAIVRKEYGLILGSLFWPLLLLSIFTPYTFIKIIFGIFLLGDLLLGLKKEPENLTGRFVSHYVFSIYALLGLLFYFPRRKEVKWKKIH